MLTLNECKKILGIEAIGKTDEEILLIRDWLSHIADIALDAYEKKQLLNIRLPQPLLISDLNKNYN